MKILALVENYSHGELAAKHGLSLYIETAKHKILFDIGPDKILFANANKRDIDLTKIDTVIISHGHMDHGGALQQFLTINHHAKIYVQRKAFEKHYAKILAFKVNVGLAEELRSREQIILLDGDYTIDEELFLFTLTSSDNFYSSANNALYTETGKDDFAHEQNLIISGTKNTLVMGCGHAGVVNILEKATAYSPKLCVGGYHLFNPLTKRTVPAKLLDCIAKEMARYDIEYYTCHCTGKKAFRFFAKRLPNMKYLSCGESIIWTGE
jgi:7,8-dihydropterin-6-yl-methyl-4-(beta-D-ribofuranosyl)aminobenzene 5'-phosphate synthase